MRHRFECSVKTAPAAAAGGRIQGCTVKTGPPENEGTGMERHSMEKPTDGEIHLRLKDTRDACPEREELPARYFDICLEDGTRVGNCELRIGRNGRTAVSGNIGFGVYPAWRGHHFAARAVRLLLGLAAEAGMQEVLITCDPGNRASARSCELAGGVLMGTAEIPPEHPLYREGKRQVLVYRFYPVSSSPVAAFAAVDALASVQTQRF